MVTNELLSPTVDLLDGWQKLLLDEYQRGLFLAWLRAHTQLEFQTETFKEHLAKWLSGAADLREFQSEILIIHAEIIWAAQQKVEHEFEN